MTSAAYSDPSGSLPAWYGSQPSHNSIGGCGRSCGNLARRVEDLPSEDGWQIAKGACEAAALIQAGYSWENASGYMMGKSPALKYRIQAEELLKDLTQTDSSSDVIEVLGKAAFCEAADRRA
jgi:hypothetical protein